MTEKLFMSYIGLKYEDLLNGNPTHSKPIPANIFQTPNTRNLIWAIDLDVNDPAESFTKMFLTAANEALAFVVFRSSDYRKIDKLKWETAVANNTNCKSLSCFDFIDDDIDNKYAEYIVSFESIHTCVMLSVANIVLASDISKDLLSHLVAFPPYDEIRKTALRPSDIDAEILNIIANIHKTNCYIESNVLTIVDNEAVAAQVAANCIMMQFTPAVLPYILTPFINGYRQQLGLEPLGVLTEHGDYYYSKSMSLFSYKNNASHFFNSGCIGGRLAYDRIFNKIYKYFDWSAITRTMLHLHVGRNDPCPCGSGKKFKKCCGS